MGTSISKTVSVQKRAVAFFESAYGRSFSFEPLPRLPRDDPVHVLKFVVNVEQTVLHTENDAEWDEPRNSLPAKDQRFVNVVRTFLDQFFSESSAEEWRDALTRLLIAFPLASRYYLPYVVCLRAGIPYFDLVKNHFNPGNSSYRMDQQRVLNKFIGMNLVFYGKAILWVGVDLSPYWKDMFAFCLVFEKVYGYFDGEPLQNFKRYVLHPGRRVKMLVDANDVLFVDPRSQRKVLYGEYVDFKDADRERVRMAMSTQQHSAFDETQIAKLILCALLHS